MEVNPDSGDANVFRFCGEYFDTETGTIYLRARYYQASIGRFISRDSYVGKNSDPLSLNLYTYCHNNPLLYTDPSGHFSLKTITNLIKKVKDLVSPKKSDLHSNFTHDDSSDVIGMNSSGIIPYENIYYSKKALQGEIQVYLAIQMRKFQEKLVIDHFLQKREEDL